MSLGSRSVALAGLLACVLVGPASGSPVETEPEGRPRVGLVLSGGGARGAAHVGVLEVLERHRIPVDYVVGTSMGAIVGGLYAAGYPAPELRETLAGMDWTAALSDELSRRRLPFRRKEDQREFQVRGSLAFEGSTPRLPSGVVEGRNVLLALRDLTLPVATVRDFDALPLPFRAVATDINTGDRVVLSGGDLALAMRASLSVPGAFAPVEIGGRLLVDGGIADNLPVDVVRDFGPDVLVVVDVSDTMRPLTDRSSALEIVNQMLTALMRRETARGIDSLGPDDILVVPELEEIGSADFGSIARGIEAGERAAEAALDRLRGLSVSEADYVAYRASLTAPFPGPPPVESIRVETSPPVRPEQIRQRVKTPVGAPLDLERLRLDLDAVSGLGLFEGVGFELEPGTGDGVVLRIDAAPRTSRLGVLRMGLELFDDFQGGTEFGLGFRHTLSGMSRRGLELRIDARLGYRQRLQVELYQPFAGGLFVAPRLDVAAEDRPIFLEDRERARYRVRGGGGALDLGYRLGSWGELRAGYSRRRERAERRIGSSGPRELEYDDREAYLGLAVDTQDHPIFPSRGVYLQARLSRLLEGATESRAADLASFSLLQAGRVEAWRFAGLVELGALLDDDRGYLPFPLGGFLRLSGFSRSTLLGRQAALVSTRLLRLIAGESIRTPVYVGVSAEVGQVWLSLDEVALDDLLWHGSVYLASDTILGPAVLGVGFGDGARRRFFFSLGQRF